MTFQIAWRMCAILAASLAVCVVTAAHAAQPPDNEAMHDMPVLQEKGAYTVTGNEDWAALRGFGKDADRVAMMILMMVGGSGMEHMKMGSMKMAAAGYGPTTAVQGGSLAVSVTLRPNPPVIGDNTLDVLVTGDDGKPLTGLKLDAKVFMTSMDMGTATPKVVEGTGGHYSVVASFNMKGPWRVTLAGGDAKSGTVDAAFDFDAGAKERWMQPPAWRVTLLSPLPPAKVGANTLAFVLHDPTGKPVTGAKVDAAVAMTSMDMGTAHPKVTEGKDGRYSTQVDFSMAGPWRVTLTVTAPKQQPFTKAFDFAATK